MRIAHGWLRIRGEVESAGSNKASMMRYIMDVEFSESGMRISLKFGMG